MATVADIDVQIVQAQWRYRHAVWEGNELGIVMARARQNELLEERFALTTKLQETPCSP